MKRTSYGHCVAMELKRGFLERQLWVFMIIMLAYWTVMVALRVNSTMQIYSYYVSWGKIYPGIYEFDFMNIQSLMDKMLNDDLFVYFLPFLAAVVYAFSVVDDRVSGFAVQVYSKTGFARYYAGKLTASGIIGGCVCAAQMAVILAMAFVATLFMQKRMAVDGMISMVGNDLGFSGFFSDTYVAVGFGKWVLLEFVLLLLLGAFYGLMAALLAFFTNNKLLVFVVPVFVPQVFGKAVYLVRQPLRDTFETAYGMLSGFSLTFNSSDLGIAYTAAVGILCIILACLLCRGRLGLKYAEGGR